MAIKIIIISIMFLFFTPVSVYAQTQTISPKEKNLANQTGIDASDFIPSIKDFIGKIILLRLSQNIEAYYISYGDFPKRSDEKWLDELVESGEMSKSYKDMLTKFMPTKLCWTVYQEGYCYKKIDKNSYLSLRLISRKEKAKCKNGIPTFTWSSQNGETATVCIQTTNL
ncbi:MAG: hypothetical protein HYT09_00560 [Candidatus Levybacteria bacterium]|nr:hypothetical protein [Candidatus Levybacteria bacterium]